jgi:hypothetical protein
MLMMGLIPIQHGVIVVPSVEEDPEPFPNSHSSPLQLNPAQKSAQRNVCPGEHVAEKV